MNVKCFILIIILLSGWTNLSKERNDLDTLKLKGRVKSLRETSYKVTEESKRIVKGEQERQKSYENDSYVIFNEKGYKTEVTNFNQFGKVESHIIYSYDERGNNIESITYNSMEEPINKVVNVYDENGKTTECYVYGKSGALSTKFAFKYDEKGREISNRIEPYNSRLKAWELTYKYNDNGNVVEQCNINPLGIDTAKFDFVYDNKSRVVQRIAYSADNGNGKKTSFKYDRRGNAIEESECKFNGKLIRRFTYRFDKLGNTIKFSAEDSTERFYIEETYQYQYDKKRNWIKKIIFEKEIPKFIEEREIKYYSEN